MNARFIKIFLHFFLEFLYAASGINEFLFAGIKRMTLVAKLNADFLECATSNKTVTAGAGYFGIGVILWMNIFFHGKNLVALL